MSTRPINEDEPPAKRFCAVDPPIPDKSYNDSKEDEGEIEEVIPEELKNLVTGVVAIDSTSYYGKTPVFVSICDKELEIQLEHEGEGKIEFFKDSGIALKHFLDIKKKDRALFSDHVNSFAMKEIDDMGLGEEGMEDNLVDLLEGKDDPENIWDFIEPQGVVLRRRDKDKLIYVYMQCICPWDEGEAIMIVFREGRHFVHICTGTDGYLTKADAMGITDDQDELLAACILPRK